MAKIDRKRIDTWLSGTQAASGAKAQRASRTANPSSASQADQRPEYDDVGFSAPNPSDTPAPAFGAPAESVDPASFGESALSDADVPALPSRRFEDDPVGLKSLLDRLKRVEIGDSGPPKRNTPIPGIGTRRE